MEIHALVRKQSGNFGGFLGKYQTHDTSAHQNRRIGMEAVSSRKRLALLRYGTPRKITNYCAL